MNQQYFNKISNQYELASGSVQAIYDQVSATLNPLVRGATVLDVGNGGKFSYDTRLPEKIIAMDVAANMLDRITDPSIIKLVDDARTMDLVPDSSVDVIVFQLMLHHVTGRTMPKTLTTLRQVLSSAARKLRAGGSLVIVETILGEPMSRLQRALYPITNRILEATGRSMIAFFTRKSLVDAVSACFGVEPASVEVTGLGLETWFDPLMGSYPGVIKIPGWLSPTRFTLLTARKPETSGGAI